MKGHSLLWDRLLSSDMATYDPYDLWKTRLGLWLRKCYYRRGKVAIPLVAPFYLLDFYAPRLIRAFMKPQEYPIVRAMGALTALNLYGITSREVFLKSASCSVTWLINNKSSGYHGACWGLNFPWETKNRYYSPQTPFVTHTPYCVEALLRYHDVTQDAESLDVALSAVGFLKEDLAVLWADGSGTAVGYGPGQEERIVINANAYAMMLYGLLATRMPDRRDELLGRAARIYTFVASCQRDDGSWLYYHDNGSGNFIDCFHTCFILKNIVKYGRYSGSDVGPILVRGLENLEDTFVDDRTYLARRFSLKANPSLVKYDLYDQAELLNVYLLTGQQKRADQLYAAIYEHFYRPADGSFGCSIDIFGMLNTMTYLRWPLMPLMYVLSEYWKGQDRSGLLPEALCAE